VNLNINFFIANELGMLNQPDYELVNQNTVEVKKMLASFIKKLKAEI